MALQAQLYPENMGLQAWMVSNPVPAGLLHQPLLHQRPELDWFLQFQNERLRSALQHFRNREVAAMEAKLACLMKQKEDELAQAIRRAMVLRECVVRAEAQRDRWRKLAVEREATVVGLGDAMERVEVGAGDAESLCCGSGEEGEELEVDMACKSCNARRSSVLFLPCRHLCSCMSCEALLGSCPVCGSVKEASMEVFLA